MRVRDICFHLWKVNRSNLGFSLHLKMWLWRVSLHSLTARFLFLARVEVFKVDYLWTCISPRSSLSKGSHQAKLFPVNPLSILISPVGASAKALGHSSIFSLFWEEFWIFLFFIFFAERRSQTSNRKKGRKTPPSAKVRGGEDGSSRQLSHQTETGGQGRSGEPTGSQQAQALS